MSETSRSDSKPAKSGKAEKPVVLIMAGGKGERFWPRSRTSHPKQLQKVYSDKTLLEETLLRARALTDPDRIFIGCNAELKDAIRKTHKSVKKKQFVVEPEARNTAPIIALAALQLEERFPGAVQIVLSADHYIAPLESFRTTMQQAAAVAREEARLVTMGVRPNRPETGYGYIHAGAETSGGQGAREIRSFVEKPDLNRAKEYLATGEYFWNSGMFVWRGDVILEEFAAHAPEILEPLRRDNAFASKKKLAAAFAELPKTPVDIAILEKSQRIAMLSADFAWDDVGSWASLERIGEPDASGNMVFSGGKKQARIAALDSRNNLVVTKKPLVALLGIENAILVEDDDALFLASRNQIDRIKELLGELKENPDLQKYLR